MSFESYLYQVKGTVTDEKLKDKLTEDDKKATTVKCKELEDWLMANTMATVE